MVKEKNVEEGFLYRPVAFIIGTFSVTWICAVILSRMDYEANGVILTVLDFIESASPLIFVLILLRGCLFKDRFLLRFILGERRSILAYAVVAMLFVFQFLNFYLFQMGDAVISIQMFAVTFVGQLLLGGGLEEAGWRGYLLPALHRKLPLLLASLCVSIIWVIWHLPYFILPGTMHSGGNLISYAIIGIVTGFILTAIYKLTKSVLLCTLFHSWQNTIVMTVPADMQNAGFMVTFLALGVVSIVICLYVQRKENRQEAAIK